MSAYDEYLAATKGKGLTFTKDFTVAILAVMNDELAPPAQRVLAWAKFRAWGKQRLYCVRDDGQPAFQKDCAQELNLHKSTVSKTYAYLEMRGYVQLEGKLLYPALSPELIQPPDRKVSDSETFASYLEVWKVANSATFDEWQVADATAKRCKLVALRDYRDEMARKQSAPLPIPKDLEDSDIEEEKQTDRPLSELLEAPAPDPVRLSVSPPPLIDEKPISEQVHTFLTERFRKIKSDLKDPVLSQIAAPLEKTPGAFEAFKSQVIGQRPPIDAKSWTYFPPIANDVAVAEMKRPKADPDACECCLGKGTVMAITDRGEREMKCRNCNGTGQRRKPADSEHAEPKGSAKGAGG